MVLQTINLKQFEAPAVGGRSTGGCGSCGSGSAAAGGDDAKCGNGLEKIYPTTAVRFGYMRYIGEFTHASDMKFSCGAKVVIQTKRGLEIGEQVSLSCGGCDKSVTRDQMKEWVDRCGEDAYIFSAGRILREATAADLSEWTRIQASRKERLRLCQQTANQFELPINLVEVESMFGGERIVFFFMAEERVDFRALVKELAREYRTRIEMRQVGARDEARLLADFETCGREICCKSMLKTLRPVSMRMAKVQKATLDPGQVSGRCGRLKCCLRFEHIGYEELDKLLPRNGKRIETQHGDGVVINRQILTQLVQIRTDDDKIIAVVVEDILKPGETRRVIEPPELPEPEFGTPPRRESKQTENGPSKQRSGNRGSRRGGRSRSRKRTTDDKKTTNAPAPSENKTNGPSGTPSADSPPAEGTRRRSRRRGGRRRRKPPGSAGKGGESKGDNPTPPA